jgi:hypothetical protein
MPNPFLQKKLEDTGNTISADKNSADSPNYNNTTTKCGVICQKKKKRKVLLIGFGVLLVGGISYFILKKK